MFKEISVESLLVCQIIDALGHAMCDEVGPWMLQHLRVLPPEAIEEIETDKGFKIFCGSAGDFYVTSIATEFENSVKKEVGRISTDDVATAMRNVDCDYWEILVTWHTSNEVCECCDF